MMKSEEVSAKSVVLTEKPICKVCFKDIRGDSLLTFFSSAPPLCLSCFKSLKENLYRSEFNGFRLYYLSPYRSPLKELLLQYKENNDVELAPVFLSYYVPFLRLLFPFYNLVPVPSSPSHLKKRGFSHLELIYKAMKLPVLDLLGKKEGREQKKLNAEERRKSAQLFYLKNNQDLSGKKILLTDDVLTSGTSLNSCLNLLLKLHPKKIVLFVIMNARDPDST